MLAATVPCNRLLLAGPRDRVVRDRNSVRRIALTFDDGPHPEWTPAVLEELSRAGWTATFFVIGERAERHPDLVRQIVKEGHAIGNHTFTHGSPSETSSADFLNEVKCTSDLIAELTGLRTTLVRPPLGRLTGSKLCGLWAAQQSVILWNVDPKDFAMTQASQAAAWTDRYHPSAGDVVLLHDRLGFAASIVGSLARQHGPALQSVALTDWLPKGNMRVTLRSPAAAWPPDLACSLTGQEVHP
ncbi:MAG: polysaccharide deacetylase family protein [Planctomycetaceae bacterium]|nr:polysaccharide deacetylase family protein [Planctomycetaceae bacterium]